MGLNRHSEKWLTHQYVDDVDDVGIVLRVSGRLRDFESEDPERLRRSHKGRYISIELVLPEKVWENITIAELAPIK